MSLHWTKVYCATQLYSFPKLARSLNSTVVNNFDNLLHIARIFLLVSFKPIYANTKTTSIQRHFADFW